jgi:hypothetical protein
MSFFLRRGWWGCQFLEADLQTSLPKKLSFKDEAKTNEHGRGGGAFLNLESRQSIDHAISIGHGGIWLELTGSGTKSSRLDKIWCDRIDSLSQFQPCLPQSGCEHPREGEHEPAGRKESSKREQEDANANHAWVALYSLKTVLA